MQLDLGDKIRQLRREQGRTQEALAEALGITSQAVSRWEAGGSYPDMEAIPAIANYFGVTIDELFGYQGDRERKINELIARVDELDEQNSGVDVCLDQCIGLLREGLAEFPGNEKITLRLGKLLSEAGWIRNGERCVWDENGYKVHDLEYHRDCVYWQEAVGLLEHIVSVSVDQRILQEAGYELTLLYRNFREYDKAEALAQNYPELKLCRENILTYGADGEREAKYIGEALLAMVSRCSWQMVMALKTQRANFEGDGLKVAIETVKNSIGIYDVIFTDQNYGMYHEALCCRYLYLSKLQWAAGMKDEAFASLDRALEHRKAFEEAFECEEGATYTAPLLTKIRVNPDNERGCRVVERLPEDWPWWHGPECSEAEREMKADPRWQKWVEKTKMEACAAGRA